MLHKHVSLVSVKMSGKAAAPEPLLDALPMLPDLLKCRGGAAPDPRDNYNYVFSIQI